MWCDHCQADRAAEANAETQEVTCATCGARLTSQQFGKLDLQMQKARELLDRWSKEPLLEPYSPLPDKHAAHLPEIRDLESTESDVKPIFEKLIDPDEEETNAEFPSMGDQFEQLLEKTRQTKMRYDLAHGSDREDQIKKVHPEADSKIEPPGREHKDSLLTATLPTPPLTETPIDELPATEPVAQLQSAIPSEQIHDKKPNSKIHRTDPPPPQTAPATHLNIQQLIEERLEHKTRKVDWMMMVGQWLAYLGVLAMTAGAAVIVFGYFGGAEGMTPRGWMLTTAGQMLLFLGIVTLISSGMERSSEEITDRIDLLGEQLFRLESEARKHFVKGPKLSPENYAEDADSQEPEPVKEDVTGSV